jgi:hypothetical protein
MCRAETMSNVIDSKEVAYQQVPLWFDIPFRQALIKEWKEMSDDPFINGVKILNIKRIVREGHVG